MSGLEFLEFSTFILGLAYFFSAMYLLSQQHPLKSEPPNLPMVAVLVAMRNEQDSVATCLESLADQNYPAHLYKIWILNDRSTDRSPEIAADFAKQYANVHFKDILTNRDGLSGKMNVLAQALDEVDAEIILITDADCIVPQTWIRTQVAYFDEQTGMVGGLTSLLPTAQIKGVPGHSNLFSKMQALDWLYLQTVAAGSSQAGKPITILGNNFGFRKKAYEDVGGFKQLGFSVTEDFKLMQAMVSQTKWKIRHTTDSENTIYSKPVERVKDFYAQRSRWIFGGRRARPFAYLIVGLSLLAHLAVLATFSVQLWTRLAAIALGLIIGMDYFILKKVTRITAQRNLLRWFLPFEIYYISNLILFSLTALIPQKVRWKDRNF